MKKILTLGIILISSLIILVGCGKEELVEPLTEIEAGIYIGEQNKETQFIPKLTLNEDNSFEFCTSKTFTYSGQYHIDNNMIILTITEDKSYTFSKKGENLKLNEEIPNEISKNTEFHLWGSFNAKTVEKTEETSTQ